MKQLTPKEKAIIFDKHIKTYFKYVEADSPKARQEVLCEFLSKFLLDKTKQNERRGKFKNQTIY